MQAPAALTAEDGPLPLTFASTALPGDDLAADPTRLHLLEGLYLEVVCLGGFQVLWLQEERDSGQAWAEERNPEQRG